MRKIFTNLDVEGSVSIKDSLRVGDAGEFQVNTSGTTTTKDIEVTESTKGIILKSQGGLRFRLRVTNDGVLWTEPI